VNRAQIIANYYPDGTEVDSQFLPSGIWGRDLASPLHAIRAGPLTADAAGFLMASQQPYRIEMACVGIAESRTDCGYSG
jgi:hypothetical protein